jgi:hypothetical protein
LPVISHHDFGKVLDRRLEGHQGVVDLTVQLVVPEPLIAKFPASIRTDIVTLESFLGDLRLLVPGAAWRL